MIKEHVHSFRKVGGKLYCISPTCSRKVSPLEFHGKLVACPQCQSQFILNIENIGPKTLQISCCKCDPNVPFHPNLETQREMLNDIVMEELNQTIGSQRRALERQKALLIQREADLDLQHNRYKERQAKVQHEENLLKEQRERIARKFRDLKVRLYAKLAIEKQKLLITPVGDIVNGDEAGEAMLRVLDKIYKGEPS